MLSAKSITHRYRSRHDPAYLLSESAVTEPGRRRRPLPGVDDADHGPCAPGGVGTADGAGRAMARAQPAPRRVVGEGVALDVHHLAQRGGVVAAHSPYVVACDGGDALTGRDVPGAGIARQRTKHQ